MKRIFVCCVLVLAFSACRKDKVQSTPHLEFKSFNKNPLDSADQFLIALLDFTDKEGDLDSVFMTRQRLNVNDPSPTYFDFPLRGTVPAFGNQSRGELQLNLETQYDILFNLNPIRIPNSSPRRNEIDTLRVRFYVKDKAGHTSDTAVAKTLYVIR